MRAILFLMAIICLASGATGQLQQRGLIRAGVGLNVNHYVGDLQTEHFAFQRQYPGVGLWLTNDAPRRIKYAVEAGTGRIAEQADPQFYVSGPSPDIQPNTYVSTDFFYGNLSFQFRPIRYHRFQPFLTAGGGVMYYSPKDFRNVGLTDQEYSRLEDEQYSLLAFQLPVGAGFEYKMTPALSLQLQFQHRFLSTDYIDNIGRLGPVKGNDFIQSLQAGVSIAPVPSKANEIMFIPHLAPLVIIPQPDTVPADVFAPSMMAVEFLLKQGKEVVFEVGATQEQELKGNETLAVPKPKNSKEEEELGSDEYAWLWRHLEDKAIREGKYFYYECAKGETYFNLYEKFRVRPHTIRSLNKLGDTYLPPYGSPIKIPDTRKWMEMFPDLERIVKESGAKPPKD